MECTRIRHFLMGHRELGFLILVLRDFGGSCGSVECNGSQGVEG